MRAISRISRPTLTPLPAEARIDSLRTIDVAHAARATHNRDAHDKTHDKTTEQEDDMLGEKIGSFQGKVTGQRVLPAEGGRPKFETSAETSGTILGAAARLIGTYWSMVMPDGWLYGENPWQGVTMTQDGDTGIFTASGVGRFKDQGGVSFRGAAYHQEATGKLAPLNGLALVFEWEVDGSGNAQLDLWEWK
jgi:hypothetical protein